MSVPGRDFTELSVIVPLKGQQAAQNPMQERDMQPLGALERPNCIQRVIVCFGIDDAQLRWFVRRHPDHSTVPLGALGHIGLGRRLDIGKQGVIVALKGLMVAGLSAKIEDQLEGANNCNCHANPVARQPVDGEHIADSCRPQNDHEKVEPSVAALQRPAPRRVIEGITQDIEADVLAVGGRGHFFFPVFGAGGGADGCLGPTDVVSDGLNGCVNVAAGCLGPTPKLGVPDGPLDFFPSLIRIISGWLVSWGCSHQFGRPGPTGGASIAY